MGPAGGGSGADAAGPGRAAQPADPGLLPQGSCSLPDEALPLASAPLTESGLTELQRNGNFLLWFCSGLAILVSFAILIQAVLEICRGGRKRR